MRPILLSVTVLLLPAILPARQAAPFRTGVEGVRIDVLVSDGGRPVTGLTADDFEVLDQGVPQRLETAAMATAVNEAVLLDVSFSVLDSGNLPRLVAAARALFASLRPTDSAALLTFSRGTRLVVPSTPDTRTLTDALFRAADAAPRRQGDGTAMWDAIFAAASTVVGQRARSAILLLSDGDDTVSWLFTNQPDTAKWIRDQKSRSADVLRGSGVVVDVVWVPRYRSMWTRHDGSEGQMSPTEPASVTGGVSFDATDKNLPERLAQRLEALRSGYVLTYTPSGVPHDDGWHKLTVRVKHKGKVQARPGYFAGRGAAAGKHE